MNNIDAFPFEPFVPSTKYCQRFKNLTGQRFGRLVVFSIYGKSGKGNVLWLVRCDCGSWGVSQSVQLTRNITDSCGCLTRQRSQTHGEGAKPITPEYRAYGHAKNRCQNPNNHRYEYYGGRGIEFRFDSYEEFLAEVGRRPSDKHSLDRIDNNGHYERGNLRWATMRQQALNRRPRANDVINGLTRN